MADFDFGRSATQGARHYQEDTAAVWPGGDDELSLPENAGSASREDDLIAVLADGMGGHAGGALASRTVCETFLAACACRNGPVPERLVAALEAANSAVAEQVVREPMLAGMGSTVIGTYFSDAGVEWISVGDSPLLLYRRGEVAVLNEDHSLAPELDRLVELGHMSVDEALHDPRRHMLRSAVTGEDIDLVDVSLRPLQLEPGDYVILASDGLHTLDNGEVARIVQAYGKDGPGAVASALIRAVEAMREPHQDNATVVAVRLKPEASKSA